MTSINRIKGMLPETKANAYIIWVSLDKEAPDYLKIIRENYQGRIVHNSRNFAVCQPALTQRLEYLIIKGELDSKTLKDLEEVGHLVFKQVTEPKTLERIMNTSPP